MKNFKSYSSTVFSKITRRERNSKSEITLNNVLKNKTMFSNADTSLQRAHDFGKVDRSALTFVAVCHYFLQTSILLLLFF